MKKTLMLFGWFIRFGLWKSRDEYRIHDYIKASFCPEFMDAGEFDEKEQLLRDTPGPAGIKYAYYVGNKVNGIFGAVAAITALLVPVVAAAAVLYFFYEPFINFSLFKNEKGESTILNGMHATALGLIVAHLYKIVYFNRVNRKSLAIIIPAAVAFIFLGELVSLNSAVLMPFCILAVILFGVTAGLIQNAAVKYREKHPKYIDPYSRKAQKLRDRQIQEEEHNLKKDIDDNTIKARRQQLEEEAKKKKHKFEE